jgi:F0F1-type ATP synthase membrane subunit b/b'
MTTITVILVVLLVVVGVTIYLVKQGKIKDADGDYIPDVIEEAVEDVKEFADDVKETAKEVKKRAKAVKRELADVIEEAKDVKDALKGKITKSKLRGMTKKQLLDHAKVDLGEKLDSGLSKTNLINQIYSIHHSK